MSSLICISIFVLLLTVLVQSEIKLNPKWVKPDIYSRDRLSKNLKTNLKSELETVSSSGDGTEESFYQEEGRVTYNNDDLSVYYKKIVKFIIKTSKMKASTGEEPSDDEYLIRTINFKITKKQMEQLEKSDDILELDGLFSDIIYQSEGGSFNFLQEAILSWSDLIMIKSSEYLNWNYIKFFGYISGMLLISFLIGRRFKIHIIVAILLVTGMIRFFGEYQLCNKRKEYEKLASLTIRERNPCDLTVPKGFGDYFKSFFGGNSKDECIKHLMEKFEPQIEFCDPLDVFLDFCNNIMFKQISQFFIKLGEISSIISASTKFPYNVIILAFLFWVLKDFIITGLKLTFKYMFLAIKERSAPTPTSPIAQNQIEPPKRSRLDNKRKRKIRIRQLVSSIENRIEPLPEITDVSDVTDSEIVNPSQENEDNEFEIVKVDTIVKEAKLEPSTSTDAIKKEN